MSHQCASTACGCSEGAKEEYSFRNSPEGLIRKEVVNLHAYVPELVPEIKFDHHGLVWSDGKVLLNLFQCAHIVKRVDVVRSKPPED